MNAKIFRTNKYVTLTVIWLKKSILIIMINWFCNLKAYFYLGPRSQLNEIEAFF